MLTTDQQVRQLWRLDARGTRCPRRPPVGRGCQDRPQVPPARPAPQRGTDAAFLAHSPGPVRRRLGRRRRATGSQPGAGGVDPAPATPAGTSRPLPRWPTPHVPAAGQDVARGGRPGEGSVLRPGPHARPTVCVRLHAHDGPAGDHQRPAVRAPDLPLRAHLLELGDRHGVLRRVVRDARRRVAERAGRTRRRAGRSPHRPTHGRDPAGPAGAEFTQRYQALLSHYGLDGQAIRAGHGNENGDVEQRHHRFKRALDQQLMLRASRDFTSREAYQDYLRDLFAQLNANRGAKTALEMKHLRALPPPRTAAAGRVVVTVDAGSTIHVKGNTYSASSRLIGERVEVRLHAEEVEVWYAQKVVERVPRLRGRGQHRINYRHVIDWLVRKPGAFAAYRYRDDLFPTTTFRVAYDVLRSRVPGRADREYLRLLQSAARDGEVSLGAALRAVLDGDGTPTADEVSDRMRALSVAQTVPVVAVGPVDLSL